MKSLHYRITAGVSQLVRTHHAWVAGAILSVMAALSLGSMVNNSAIMDELAHIPAAYSYWHFGDYRLNPEHPPLLKDLAGLPLQFLNLKFPTELPAWRDQVNGQWETGFNFLYHIGNDADAILFWSRLPLLLLALGFGVALYVICRRRWGTAVGLLALFFYALSPTVIAHSALVTTDVGASIFIFLAIISFARYVEAPSRASFIWLSVGLATAQLSKFSAFVLYPILLLVTLAFVWAMPKPTAFREHLKTYVGGLIGASTLSMAWVWLVYAPQTWNMSASLQDRLIEQSLYNPNTHWLATFLTSINDVAIFKPLVQYVLGLGMVFTRVGDGNVTYFNGQVTQASFHWYFPELMFLKTQIAFEVLTILVVAVALWRVLRDERRRGWIRKQFSGHVLEWTLAVFSGFYFAIAVAGNLNLGIRHLMPIFVPLFVLISIGIAKYLRTYSVGEWRLPLSYGLVALLLCYGTSTAVSFPNYLSYFNGFIGGGQNASDYFSDSSVDWGQDLKRLKTYVDHHPEINHLAIDYFGGGVPEYYFCPRKYNSAGRIVESADGYDCSKTFVESWHAQNGPYSGGYIAVSETFLEGDRYYAPLNGYSGYGYLRERTPVAKIGSSIYLYDLQ